MKSGEVREFNKKFLNSYLSREQGVLFNLNSRDLIKFIPDKFAQTIYFDPPFSNNPANDIPHEEDRRSQDYDKYVWFVDDKKSFLSTCEFYLSEFHRILKDSGSVFLHLPWDLAYDIKPVADRIFGGDEYLKNEIIWVWRRWTTNTPALQENHHTILWYAKQPSKTTFNKLTMPRTKQTLKRFGDGKIVSAVDKATGKRVPSTTEGKSSDTPLNDVWVWDDTKKTWLYELDEIDSASAIANQRDVWGVSHTAPIKKLKMAGKDTTYPFEKPIALLERLIAMTTSKESDIVVDLFAGTGVVGEAAKSLNRRCLLNEISSFTTLDVIKRLNYKKLVPGFPLFSHPTTMDKQIGGINGRDFEFWCGYTLGGVSDDSFRGRDSLEGLDVIVPISGEIFLPGEVKKTLSTKDEWYKIKAKSENLFKQIGTVDKEYAVVTTKVSKDIFHLMREAERTTKIAYKPFVLSEPQYAHLIKNKEIEDRIKLDEINSAKKAAKKEVARRKKKMRPKKVK